MDQFGFGFDLSRCSGCFASVVACMDQNDFKTEGPSFRQVIGYEKGRFPSVKISYLSLSCAHCGEAPCMTVCPTAAISKSEDMGVVTVDRNLCIGCHTCSVTCKNVWTNRKGVEYAWFNNVESKPGVGYPKEWENQETWRGGWELKNGKLQLKSGSRLERLLAGTRLRRIP